MAGKPKEVTGVLGDGELNIDGLTMEEFLAKYPDGVFRPIPPSWVEVHGVQLPPAVARALETQESKS